ncbi:hypothetical protein GCM10022245_22270 [Streptomyces mayteni]
MVLAVALSLASAVCYATAAVIQERTAARAPGIRAALTSGRWWGSVLLNAVGALLHVVALRYGALTLVQPLGALTLVAAVPLGALISGHRTSSAQWRGVSFTLLGLVTLLTVTISDHAPSDSLSTGEIVGVAVVATAVIGAIARFASSGSTRGGLAFAAASGIASGVGSSLAQRLAVEPESSWSMVLVGALTGLFAVSGLLLAQQAYRSGLGAPLAVLTVMNPVAASAIGITLLDEGFRYGVPGVLLTLAGAAAAVHGVTLLSRAQARQGLPGLPGLPGSDGRVHRGRHGLRSPCRAATGRVPGQRRARPARSGSEPSSDAELTGGGE